MKLPAEESVIAFKDLLKVYQQEIESLSKRCRQGETAFGELNLGLNKLSERPTQQTTSSEEASKLKLEIHDLEKELMTMKNQDVAVRRLEARVKELETQKKTDIGLIEAEAIKRLDEAETKATIRIENMNAELEHMRNRGKAVEAELAELNQLRLLDRQKAELGIKAKEDEIYNLNHEIENLQVKVSSNAGSSGTLSMYKELVEKGEARISVLDREVQSLKAELAKGAESHTRDKSSLEQRISDERAARKLAEDTISGIRNIVAESDSEGVSLEIVIRKTIEKVTSDASLARASLEEVRAENLCLIDQLNRKITEDSNVAVQRSFDEVTSVPTTGTNDVVSIIQAQRDRFRTRVLELESERDQLKQSQFDQSNRINVLLGESRKIENEKNFWKSQSVEQKIKSPVDIELGSMTATGAPSLSSAAKKRTHGQPGDMEQTLTSILVWGLGNPVTRRACLLYLITLHLLVFFVLYRLSSILSSSK